MTAGDEPDVHSVVIGIVTVTYFPGTTIDAFLDSIPAAAEWSSLGGPPRVVMADNGSTDGSVERIGHRTDVRVLSTGGNLGFGGGANAGVKVLDPAVNWVLICNSDMTLGVGSLDELAAATARHPRAGALGPLLLTPDGAPYPSARELPSVGRGAGHALFGWVWPTNPWTKAYRRDHDVPTERRTGWLSGACLLVRRSAFDAINGFDPAFFMYFEDVDLGDRLGRAGWESIYVPSAEVVHIGGESTKTNKTAMVSAHHRSAYLYLCRRYPRWWQAPLRLALRVGLAARSVIARRVPTMADGAALPGSEH